MLSYQEASSVGLRSDNGHTESQENSIGDDLIKNKVLVVGEERFEIEFFEGHVDG